MFKSIELQQVYKNFTERELFAGLDINFKVGEIHGLIGKSGSGKSTIVNMICGFDFPNSGKVLIDGKIAEAQDFKSLRTCTAYVPQNVNIIGSGKVRETIQSSFEFKSNKSKRPNNDQILSVIKHLGLDENILESEFKSTSGGEKQRIAIAIATLLDKQIMIFDEPSSGLDDRSKEIVAAYISNLRDKIIIISTHDLVLKEICTSMTELEQK
ncbi:MAG: ATP-binding cassette domain-containing protein [Candidatus Kapabacteria bacterium]|nr:ATP-binding cassette domain-containing protein [Candidatus Kapabacteria bacterium]